MSRSDNRQSFSPQGGGAAPTELLRDVFIRAPVGGFDHLVQDAQEGGSYDSLGPLAINCIPVSVDRVVQDGPFIFSVTVDMNDNSAKQPLFTVPTLTNSGRSVGACIISAVTIRGASTNLDTATGQFGFDANAANVIAGPVDFSDLVDATRYDVVPADLGAVRGAGGQVFGFKVATEQGAPATAVVDVFGYLIVGLE